MVKHTPHVEIKPHVFEKLVKVFPVKEYKSPSILFYEGQNPISGFLLVEGVIRLSKRKYQKMIYKGSLIGALELIKKQPTRVKAEVISPALICFLDKGTLLKAISLQTEPRQFNNLEELLYQFISKNEIVKDA